LQLINLPCKEPVEHCDGLAALVVARDGDVHLLEGCVGVAECHHGAVGLGALHDRLPVGAWVGHDHQARFVEVFHAVVSESTWDPVSCVTACFGVLAELEHSTLALRAL